MKSRRWMSPKYTFRCRVDKILTTLSNAWVKGYKNINLFVSYIHTSQTYKSLKINVWLIALFTAILNIFPSISAAVAVQDPIGSSFVSGSESFSQKKIKDRIGSVRKKNPLNIKIIKYFSTIMPTLMRKDRRVEFKIKNIKLFKITGSVLAPGTDLHSSNNCVPKNCIWYREFLLRKWSIL